MRNSDFHLDFWSGGFEERKRSRIKTKLGDNGVRIGARLPVPTFARMRRLQSLSSLFSYPLHSRTGSRGYFGNRGSRADNSHLQNTIPRSDSTMRAFTHSAHKPTLAR